MGFNILPKRNINQQWQDDHCDYDYSEYDYSEYDYSEYIDEIVLDEDLE